MKLVLTMAGLLCLPLTFYSVAYAALYINEVLPDPAYASDASEWVELVNASSQEVDANGWSLNNKVIQLAEPVIVPAGGMLIVTKNLAAFGSEFGSTAPQVIELPITLSNSGSTVTLISPSGQTDSISYPSSKPSRSWERGEYHCSQLILHPTAHTVGQPNSIDTCDGAAVAVVQDPQPPQAKQLDPGLVHIRLTEFMPNPEGVDTNKEWIELHNPTELVVWLDGLSVWDSDGSMLVFAAGDAMLPGQYLQVFLNGSPLKNCSSSDCVEKIVLKVDGIVSRSVEYSVSPSGQSLSLDGSGLWRTDMEVTPAESNRSKVSANPNPVTRLEPAANQGNQQNSQAAQAQQNLQSEDYGGTSVAAAWALTLPELQPNQLPSNPRPASVDVQANTVFVPSWPIFAVILLCCLVSWLWRTGWLFKLKQYL